MNEKRGGAAAGRSARGVLPSRGRGGRGSRRPPPPRARRQPSPPSKKSPSSSSSSSSPLLRLPLRRPRGQAEPRRRRPLPRGRRHAPPAGGGAPRAGRRAPARRGRARSRGGGPPRRDRRAPRARPAAPRPRASRSSSSSTPGSGRRVRVYDGEAFRRVLDDVPRGRRRRRPASSASAPSPARCAPAFPLPGQTARLEVGGDGRLADVRRDRSRARARRRGRLPPARTRGARPRAPPPRGGKGATT